MSGAVGRMSGSFRTFTLGSLHVSTVIGSVAKDKDLNAMKPTPLHVLTILTAALVAAVSWHTAATTPAASAASGQASARNDGLTHRFEKVSDTIYNAVTTVRGITESNSAVIINRDDVLIVDSHVTPWTAERLVQDIRTLTDKPVRWVVNSHYHFDHAHGNQIFVGNAMIVGTEYTRKQLLTNVLEQMTSKSFTDVVPGRIENLKKQLAAEPDAAKKAELQGQLAVQDAYWASLQQIRPTPPNLTINTRTTLFFGDREVQLLFLGRGHTGGDLVLYLPRERVLATGDLMEPPPLVSYAGDGYVEDWINTLEQLKKYPFDAAIPGHGPVFRDANMINQFQTYLRDLLAQVRRLKQQGLLPEEAAKQIDMTAHAKVYTNIRGAGVDVRGVRRLYDLLDGRDLIR